jgi:hypothetical protein
MLYILRERYATFNTDSGQKIGGRVRLSKSKDMAKSERGEHQVVVAWEDIAAAVLEAQSRI